MQNINPAYEIERLLQFGKQWGLLGIWDVTTARNALLDLLQVPEPCEIKVVEKFTESAVEILDNLLDYGFKMGLLPENSVTYRDLLDARIMGLLMPRQTEVVENFYKTLKEKSVEAATDEYYQLSKASNYIKMDRIAKNLYWLSNTEYGDIEITVNLSKPEKDPKTIAAERNMKQSSYPKCLLCFENVGYAGRLNHPARQNHRVIPLELDKEQWFIQYSPYVYYNEHCIVFSQEHRPMKISENTFTRLLDYVEQLPHYFLGSNADIPIVGGSILSHDHFQGGHHIFPMEKAPKELSFVHEAFPEVKSSIVKWPMSVVRISGNNKSDLVRLANVIMEQWREYKDRSADILPYSDEGGKVVPHNAITPIARKNGDLEFEMDLVLRNNRTSAEHPDGIFHPHQELHHIKKENIGLIEVMGLAVLPGRLEEEMKGIELILTGEKVFDEKEIMMNESLKKHFTWISEMAEKYGCHNEAKAVQEILRVEIGSIFTRVLEDAGVFKRNSGGINSFIRFMKFVGFKEK